MSVSIIIPTLNEESCLEESLAALRGQRPFEIIVVDGGSTDRTLRIASAADKVVSAPRGRSPQMNLGADCAAGDVLLFLHADCTLEDGAVAEAESRLKCNRVVGGCFRMEVRAAGALYRAVDLCATARVRLTGIIYGDQGLFVRRDLFQRLGGFPRVRLMEDLLFSKTLRRHGRIAVAARRIFVSSRRWQKAGLIRQSLRNWTLTALVAGGMHPDSLARFYPEIR